MVNYKIDATEVIGGLDYVIDPDCPVGNSDCVRLEYIASLFFCKSAALYVVGIICQFYLGTMIDTTFRFAFFLLPQSFQKRGEPLFRILPGWERSICRDIPGLSDQICPGDFALGAYSGARSASNSSLKRSKRCSLTYKK